MSARKKYTEWELKVWEMRTRSGHHSFTSLKYLFLDLVSKPMSETVFEISLNKCQKQMGMTSSIWKLLIWRKIYFLSMCKWLIKSEVCAEKLKKSFKTKISVQIGSGIGHFPLATMTSSQGASYLKGS